jgi:hypothetical protein
VWIGAGAIYLFAALVSLAVTRWLPVSATDRDDMLDEQGRVAASALAGEASPVLAGEVVSEPIPAPEPHPVPEPSYAPEPAYVPEPAPAPEPVSAAVGDGSSRGSLERIAVLLEEIERRRERESRKSA